MKYELNLAVLQYLSKQLTEGDYDEVARFGLLREDINEIKNLKLEDLELLAQQGASFIMLSFDRLSFTRSIKRVQERRREEDLVTDLIEHGATQPMMQKFFGMSGVEYANRRRVMGIDEGIGRTPIVSHQEEKCIWDAFCSMEVDKAEMLTAEQWLAIAKKCNLSLRSVALMLSSGMAQENDAKAA